MIMLVKLFQPYSLSLTFQKSNPHISVLFFLISMLLVLPYLSIPPVLSSWDNFQIYAIRNTYLGSSIYTRSKYQIISTQVENY